MGNLNKKMGEKIGEQIKTTADYWLYFLIGSLGAAMAVTDWRTPQAYIGVIYAGFIALKAKRSGNGATEGKK